MVGKISKTEIYGVIGFLAIGAIFVAGVNPYLQNAPWFYNLNPLLAYPLYNIGWILLFTVSFGIPIGYFVKRSVSIKSMLLGGLAGFSFHSWVFDTLQSPFYLAKDGSVLIPVGTPSLQNTAVDVFWATIWAKIGFSGAGLYYATYFGTIIITIVLLALLLTPKAFYKHILKN